MATKLLNALGFLAAILTLSTSASAGTIDVIGTLVEDGAGCILVEVEGGDRYIPDDVGALLPGQPVRVQGDLDLGCPSACFANVGCINNAVTTLGWPVDVCGTLVEDGAGCKLVELDSGERYVLDDDGGLFPGQPVRVQGDLDSTCFSICFVNDGCINNSVTTLGWPIEVSGTLVEDGAGCKLVELGSGERYVLDNDGGLLPGQPIRVQGDLDPTCFSICFANDGCINNAVTVLDMPVDVCGTLVEDGAGCRLVELDTGERYVLDDDGGLFPGQPVRVQGDLDPGCFSICFANDGCINNAVTTLGWPVDVCGTLVEDGAGCKLVELDTGERYVLDDDGGLFPGQLVRVQGDLDPTCFSICFANDGCINNAVTTLGCPVDVCGTLVEDGAGCKLVELDSGERYVLDDDGGLFPGQPVRVQGILDPGCFSICFANDGCINGAVTTLGWPVEVCGTLVEDGAGCKLVELPTGERYVLDNDGGVALGSPVTVQGDLDPTCFSICFANDGCLFNSVTTLGCTVELCGNLVQDGAGCILVELPSGNRYILDDNGAGLPIGSPVIVTGDFDPLCGSICFANAGCVFNAVTTLGCVGTSFCTANPNSVGSGAKMAASGSASVSADDLTLLVVDVPNTPGLFFMGTTDLSAGMLPLFDGLRCTGNAKRLSPVVRAAGNSNSRVLVNANAPHMISVGSTFYFQYFYRDVMGGPEGANTSDGLAVTFEP